MNVEIGAVAAQLLFWEYVFPFSVLVLCSVSKHSQVTKISYQLLLIHINFTLSTVCPGKRCLIGSGIFADFVFIINLPRSKLPIEIGGGGREVKARSALFSVLKGLCHEMNIF